VFVLQHLDKYQVIQFLKGDNTWNSFVSVPSLYLTSFQGNLHTLCSVPPSHESRLDALVSVGGAFCDSIDTNQGFDSVSEASSALSKLLLRFHNDEDIRESVKLTSLSLQPAVFGSAAVMRSLSAQVRSH
jgi:hypothetical protein